MPSPVSLSASVATSSAPTRLLVTRTTPLLPDSLALLVCIGSLTHACRPLTLTGSIAITKNGITKLGAAPAIDLAKFKTDKKIEDEEILAILAQPLSRNTGSKSKNKKKKTAKKEDEKADEE